MRLPTVKYLAAAALLFAVLTALACGGYDPAEGSMKPPIAEQRPHEMVEHGQTRTDPYYWLKEREDDDVIAYLKAENAYAEQAMSHVTGLEDELFDEIVGRIEQNDESVPYRLEGYYYYSRFEEGREYAIYCRKEGSLDAAESVMVDGNELAEGHDYFALRSPTVSSERDLLAFAVDTIGRRIYTIRFKNLETGEYLEDEIPEVTGNMAWANDNKTLFYGKQDPTTLRSYQIYRHVLGTDPKDDELVYQEDDETFTAFVFKTKSKRFVMIASFQTLSTEYRYLEANRPAGDFQVLLPRERNHEYQVDHYQDHFYIRTNDQASNFRLVRTPVGKESRENWEEVIGHRADTYLEGFEIFERFLVAEERREGLVQLRVRPWSGAKEHYVTFEHPTYSAGIGTNPEFDTDTLRFRYESLATPDSVYDYDMKARERTLMKQDKVLGGFDTANYVTERQWATARDGVRVPVSLVRRTGTAVDGKAPLLVYGYGSYGASIDASFRSSLISLLDRGFVYAIAHIRGGEEMGRAWYEGGKLLKKKNTFTDFIDVTEFLLREGYGDKEHVFAYGGSAGGLLMGAVVNMRPDLWTGVIAAVPFVDVVTTMLDDSIPLTTGEYDEWGDPNDQTYYEYMLSYSPYDNVQAVPYPNLLVTTGLHDSQVQYWEPAKWVAKMRAMGTGEARLILKTNMDAGHGGASGRFRRHRETAYNYAFLLDLAGLAG